MSKNNKVMVLTTIYQPSEAFKKFLMHDDWDVIVVADRKTPENSYKDYELIGYDQTIKFLSVEEQESRYKDISDVIGWNCIQRRNIGFIYAYKMGYEFIATVDDDNIPYGNWGEDAIELMTTPIIEFSLKMYNTNENWFDPIYVASEGNKRPNANMWHRGFPIQEIGKRNLEYFGLMDMYKDVDVFAGFWDGDPDIDAYCRIMNNNKLVEYDTFDYFTFDSVHAFAPFNSQNTILRAHALKYYMMLPGVGRMDDIWGSYILQQSISPIIVFGPPTVYQDRNPQNLEKNLQNEVLGYMHSHRFVSEHYEEILRDVAPATLDAYKLYQTYFD